MGFKDLCKCNEAMLAKQVWRLIHNIDSIFYKVFKAKYFHRCSLFEAKVSSGSFAWKSILHSRKVVSLGAKWRIRDGSQSQIYDSNWLLGASQGHAISPLSSLPKDSLVSMLIDPNAHRWNLDIIDKNFLPFEAQNIKVIPLCAMTQPDLLYWPRSRDGSYVVNEGYQLLCEEENRELALASSSKGVNYFWKKIWGLKVLGRIKHFMWKAYSTALPTKQNLMKRNINSDDVYQLCLRQSKSTMHTLWECEVVWFVWESNFSQID